MTKGIVYHVWGNYNKAELEKSLDSAHKFGYKTHVSIDSSNYRKYQKRANLFDNSPFDVNLHLDTDTQVMANLDYGFAMAKMYGIACCIAPASSAYMATPNTIKDIMHPDQPQYNCGVIFFDKNKSYRAFEKWKCYLHNHPESKDNDQPYFSQAVAETLNPYILPKTWNFRPHVRYESENYFGELKILHSNR